MRIWYPSVLVVDGSKEFYYTFFFNNLQLQTVQQSQIDQRFSNTMWCKKRY